MLFERTFTLAQMGEILGRNPGTMRTHITRGLVVGQGPRNINDKDKGMGKHARFSFFSLMEFALAYRLTDMGVSLDVAFKSAASFAHSGGGGEVFNLPEREPGVPFHHNHGKTLFAVGRTGMTFEATTKTPNVYESLRHYVHSSDMILIDVSQLFFEVCGAMDVPPLEELDNVYPSEAE